LGHGVIPAEDMPAMLMRRRDGLRPLRMQPICTCLDSWDHVPIRSWPLFKARHVLRTLFSNDNYLQFSS
jgi:hypothetical protein